ncbi:esterase [Frankia sp. R43]|uniref:alpha/beta hydrolase n=1 Tax=Frankia sp. R43 TaxID=269536 RepID=UPI0006C9EB9E|nr:alpha/beta hydrolase-fold protein [Frankia sp. R43]KPM54455.1 esterase [Frankia sp. R43]
MGPSRRALLIATITAAGGLPTACGTDSQPSHGLVVSDSPRSVGTAATPVSPPASLSTSTPGAAATRGPVEVRRTRFASAARGREVGMAVVAPRVADGLGVCLVLHGRGDDAARAVSLLGLEAQLGTVLAAGAAPFALVTLDGGETYWHRRASGDDPETMILDEVLPRLDQLGLRTSRIAVTGWSMGGYGGLLLAHRHPERVVAVAASSPAMWHSYGASAPGAFDSKADFAAHPVLGTAPAPGVAYRIDCGESDPFISVSREAAVTLRAQERNFGPGGHTPSYWRSVTPAQLTFVGAALARTA